MNPARIAAWFQPRSGSAVAISGGGRGGIPATTWQDVAAACAGPGLRFGWHLIQARFGGNLQSAKDATDEAERLLVSTVLPKLRRRMVDPKRRRQIAALTVRAYISRTFCVSCDGNGTIQVITNGEPGKCLCPRCDGTGFREMADAEKARALGIAPQSWAWYAPVHRELLALMDQAEAHTAIVVSRRLADEEATA